jgi:hypothetical protein
MVRKLLICFRSTTTGMQTARRLQCCIGQGCLFMDLFTIEGIDISLERLRGEADGTQRLRVCNCEWQAELALLPRAHGDLGYSIEVTPLACTGNRAKFEHDLPCIQSLFARLTPAPDACLVVSHALEDEALSAPS